MLKGMMKKLGMSPDINEEETNMDVTEMASTELAADDAIVAELSALKASFAEQTEQLQAALAQVESFKEFAEMAAQAKAQAEADAKNVKLAARKATIEMNIGTDKADAMLAATENLDDDSFAAIMGVMETTAKAEAESPLFKEAGFDGKVEDVSKLTETKEMTALKKKYAAKTAKPK